MVSVTVPIEEMQQKKILVCTPMYGGQCSGVYVSSMIQLTKLTMSLGIHVHHFFISNESLITRARNYCVDEFLSSDNNYTHLVFLDADVGFEPKDVLDMAGLMSDESEYDVMCAPYPKKVIAWEKVVKAAKLPEVQKDPEKLANYIGDFVLNQAPENRGKSINLKDPIEVMEGGTGFMMIRRKTFERFIEAYGDTQTYTPDHARSENWDGSKRIVCFFDAVLDKKSDRYLSEDYMFCQWCREIGLKIWMCPWMKTSHVGTYEFASDMMMLTKIGASMTSDARKLGKNKRKNPKWKR